MADLLTEKQKKRLLEIARQTIEAYVRTGERLDFEENDPALLETKGAFVTLHLHKDLRGCIGNIVGQGPLYLTVRDMAIASATEDPRFSPVKESELDDIDIEISVLSIPAKTTDPETIQMGKHGVIVRQGLRGGVYLPQVAVEMGWSREEFLSSLCEEKAGLPSDAWKKGAELQIFTAEVINE